MYELLARAVVAGSIQPVGGLLSFREGRHIRTDRRGGGLHKNWINCHFSRWVTLSRGRGDLTGHTWTLSKHVALQQGSGQKKPDGRSKSYIYLGKYQCVVPPCMPTMITHQSVPVLRF